MSGPCVDNTYIEAIGKCREDIQELLQKRGTRAHMQIMRLAINDCMTYDAATRTGGPTGAIRVEKAAQYEHNKGLADAVESLVAVKENNAPVTFSDVLQLACFEAATAGGVPGLAFIPGRRDSRVVAPASRLLAFSSILHDGAPDPSRIKTVAKRLGVPLAHVVALLGTHPFGAAWQDPEAYEQAATEGTGPMPIDNTFFRAVMAGAEGTEHCAFLLSDPDLAEWVRRFGQSDADFKDTVAAALGVLSCLGQESLKVPVGAVSQASGRGHGQGSEGAGSGQWSLMTTVGTAAAVAAVGCAAIALFVTWRRRRARRG